MFGIYDQRKDSWQDDDSIRAGFSERMVTVLLSMSLTVQSGKAL